jgi:TatA/E family protein of Tat protein translocase
MLNSPVDLAILFGVALLVFGPKKLPELGQSLGKGIGNFKRALTDAQDHVSSVIKTEAPATGITSSQVSASTSTSSSSAGAPAENRASSSVGTMENTQPPG